MESKLSSDGVFSITAPIIDVNKVNEQLRLLPTIRTGQRAKAMEKHKDK